VRQSGVEHALLELVKTRVSQINGCAYCLDMHTKEARAHGDCNQRVEPVSQFRSGQSRGATGAQGYGHPVKIQPLK
jgi:AhpD family alkylhydroperoxidase